MNLLTTQQSQAASREDLTRLLQSVRECLWASAERDMVDVVTAWAARHLSDDVATVVVSVTQYTEGSAYIGCVAVGHDGSEVELDGPSTAGCRQALQPAVQALVETGRPVGHYAELEVPLMRRPR